MTFKKWNPGCPCCAAGSTGQVCNCFPSVLVYFSGHNLSDNNCNQCDETATNWLLSKTTTEFCRWQSVSTGWCSISIPLSGTEPATLTLTYDVIPAVSPSTGYTHNFDMVLRTSPSGFSWRVNYGSTANVPFACPSTGLDLDYKFVAFSGFGNNQNYACSGWSGGPVTWPATISVGTT